MFGKEHLYFTLTGITDGTCDIDPSPDYLQKSILPILAHFGVGIREDEAAPPIIKVTKQGASPGGGGCVEFYCPIVKELLPLDLLDPGKFKRVRGNAITCKVPPSSAARVVHSAKGLLHRLLPDVWIHTDAHSSKTCGPSPGLGFIVSAESTTGVVMTAECCMDPHQPRGQELPEDIGIRGAAMLLEAIRRGGCYQFSTRSIRLCSTLSSKRPSVYLTFPYPLGMTSATTAKCMVPSRLTRITAPSSNGTNFWTKSMSTFV